jgi:hypothetical protein
MSTRQDSSVLAEYFSDIPDESVTKQDAPEIPSDGSRFVDRQCIHTYIILTSRSIRSCKQRSSDICDRVARCPRIDTMNVGFCTRNRELLGIV